MFKLKPVVATLCALGVTAVGTSFAATTSHATIDNQISNLQMQVAQLQSQMKNMNTSGAKSASSHGMSSMGSMVGTYAPLSQDLLTNYAGAGREMYILQAKKAGKIGKGLYFGGEMQADAIYQNANNDGAFGNPVFFTGGGNHDNTAIALTSVKLDALANLNAWASGYVQIGASDAGANVGFTSPSTVKVQQAYLLLGNLAKNPFYGFVGKKDIDFGQFDSVNMYSQPLTRLAFEATGTTAGVGFDDHGFDAVISMMNGGNNNDINNPVSITNYAMLSNLRTSNDNEISNFAVNLGYGQTVDNMNWHVGAGYLNGSAYKETDGSNVGAWDLNAKLAANNFDLLAEFVMGDSDDVQNTTGDNHDVMGWNLAADYKMPVMGHNSVLSASYSNLQTNLNASQLVLGARTEAFKNVWAGIEYSYNHHILETTGNGIYATNYNGDADNNTVLFDVTAVF